MLRNSLFLLALVPAACDGVQVGNRTARAGEVTTAMPDEVDESASKAPEGIGAPMAWRVVNDAAYYGAADQQPVFALRCDSVAKQIVFERVGGGAAITLAAAGQSATIGTRASGDGRVQARSGLGDPVLDAMSRSQTPIQVGGGAEPFTVPGGIAIRRIVDTCRNPPPPAIEATPEQGPPGLVIPETIDDPAEIPPPKG